MDLILPQSRKLHFAFIVSCFQVSEINSRKKIIEILNSTHHFTPCTRETYLSIFHVNVVKIKIKVYRFEMLKNYYKDTMRLGERTKMFMTGIYMDIMKSFP